MVEIALPAVGTAAAWRDAVRRLAAEGVAPEAVRWSLGPAAPDLFAAQDARTRPEPALKIPRPALAEIETALHHSDPGRFTRAHMLVLALSRGETRWGDRSDPAQHRVMAEAKAVRRDIHKMHAFVRFRELPPEGAQAENQPSEVRRRFAAWFEPTHPVVEPAVPFFAKRFGDMDWVIATPLLTARFIAGHLTLSETPADQARPPEDGTERLWQTYYANIFNPARLMTRAMQSEMPKKYWHNLPEAELIPQLIRDAPARAARMAADLGSLPAPETAARQRNSRLPQRPAIGSARPQTLEDLAAQARACTRCPLHCNATQTVCGEGPADARLMIVGEQPGDQEDLAGRPFVGPAGQLFDRVATEAGLDRSRVWLTNAVKHFKFTPRGKRRIHQRPSSSEIEQCRWWLGLEAELIRPQAILAMGASAAEALTGSGANILRRRGSTESLPDGTPVLITLHPSALLRQPDAETARSQTEDFRNDLRKILSLVS
ncbi:UdgX family uracil-DNA binding protein [Frigidibacter sp. MR17.14]|uniref:UdgX family uracil-DNA binding protein n=1 Tax=Frigidibacter sp. MR17.14 TaxID=3126509 RepID=UPI0030130D53